MQHPSLSSCHILPPACFPFTPFGHAHPHHILVIPPFSLPINTPFILLIFLTQTLNPPMQNTEEFMASGCLDQHRFHPSSHQIYLNKKSLRDIDIPPRKLLSRRSSSATSPESLIENMYHHNDQSHSPRVLPEETLFKKFLPYNDSDEDSDPYSADHFRIYEFKVRKCTRSRSHDWTDCPFAHPGEKARRRCPRRYNYLGTVCADFRRGSCSRGDLCEFAHGVFECWLHPSRYRTEACKDGKNCQRKICFFAHTPRQLRVVPPESSVIQPKKHHTESCHCCAHCRCLSGVNHVNSPTSTLNNIDLESLSPPASPPFSPARSSGAGFSPISRFADKLARAESLGLTQFGNSCLQNEALSELVRSMEAMSVEENNMIMNNSQQWVDHEGFNNGGVYDLSDSTPSCFSRSSSLSQQNVYNEIPAVNGPDLGWVNDLLT